MRRSTYHDEHSDEGVVNLTPLIDVVFVVLIMFILVAPLLDIDRVVLAPAPERKETFGPQEAGSQIVIHVYADNTVWLNHKSVVLNDLASLLQEAKKQHPGAVPSLYQDSTAQFGTYQRVKNALENAGFEQLDIVLQPGA